MLEVQPLAPFHDAQLIRTPIFRDQRGFFSETYNSRAFADAGIAATFVQDNHACSRAQGVLRGLHFQNPPKAQDKLVRVARGSIYDVIVDLRVGSPTYGRHAGVVLSAENWLQLWIPKGFAHGYCTLEPDTEVIYKVTELYSPRDEGGIRWDDPSLGIEWPIPAVDLILSEKDKALPLMNEFVSQFSAV